jgi:hypothetical protein
MTEFPAALAHVAAPAEAQHVAQWVDQDGDGTSWGRHVRGTRRTTADAQVVLAGWQDASATVEWHATLFALDTQIDGAGLRKLAAIALDAADELDRLTERP